MVLIYMIMNDHIFLTVIHKCHLAKHNIAQQHAQGNNSTQRKPLPCLLQKLILILFQGVLASSNRICLESHQLDTAAISDRCWRALISGLIAFTLTRPCWLPKASWKST